MSVIKPGLIVQNWVSKEDDGGFLHCNDYKMVTNRTFKTIFSLLNITFLVYLNLKHFLKLVQGRLLCAN